jgi:hypothetical protein
VSTLAGILLAAWVMGTAPAAAAASFAPIETCHHQPGAAQFRAALTRAVRARDVAGLVALAAPDVKLDFGEGAGRAELRGRLAGAEGAKLWRELDRILPLGCAAQAGNLVMPSVFAHDFGEIDAFDVMVVTGANVALRSGPSAIARPIRRLSWSLVEPLSGEDFERPFRQVRVHGGGPTGFVSSAYLRSPLDYRLIVGRKGGAWRIEAFVAGD